MAQLDANRVNDPGWRNSPVGPIGIFAGILVLIASLVWAVVATRVIVHTVIDAKTARFRRAGQEFLGSLPGNPG